MKSQGWRQKKKIFVGMSGGVDSSISAALLKKAGHDVTGVFIKVWQPDWIECNWKEERLDAMRVAAHIGIPFMTLDLEKEYKQGVIDYMITEYKAGRTPNPDVMCNREIKFGAFWEWAKSQGADFIATGHYARVATRSAFPTVTRPWVSLAWTRFSFSATVQRLCSFSPALPSVRRSIVGMDSFLEEMPPRVSTQALLLGTDPNKDQSYFLWTLNQKDLAHILFPVGHLQKSEVRKLAKKFKLPNAEKKDSQGLCFIGKIDLKEFLAHYVQTKPGDVLNEKGQVIGRHPGALFFTLGERHGFTVLKKTPNDEAYFVVAKDNEQNTITVSNNKLANGSDIIKLSKCNWIRTIPKAGQTISIRTRYRQALIGATFKEVKGDSAILQIDTPLDPVTPGQSLVTYVGDECAGGGIID